MMDSTIIIAYVLVFLVSVFIYYAPFVDVAASCEGAFPLPSVGPHRHSCHYCRQVSIVTTGHDLDKRGLLIHLSLNYRQVVRLEARDCPLFERAHHATTAAPSVRIWCHVQTFFDIFAAESDVHTLTGCSTIFERAQYFARGLSHRPFHLRLSRLSSEPGGALWARVLYSSWRLFEFEVSADYGNTMCERCDWRLTRAQMTLSLLSF
jgi:hypothetical protein